jgi:hypothetical protein
MRQFLENLQALIVQTSTSVDQVLVMMLEQFDAKSSWIGTRAIALQAMEGSTVNWPQTVVHHTLVKIVALIYAVTICMTRTTAHALPATPATTVR